MGTNDPIQKAIIDRFLHAHSERQRIGDEIEKLMEARKTADAEIDDCYAAARLFKFDLLEAAKPLAELAEQNLTPDDVENLTPTATVKAHTLWMLEKAFPNFLKAAEIRDALSQRGVEIHEKTVGMTLYRLSLDGSVRREGIKWFYVRPEARKAKADENSGGDSPESDIFG